MLGAVDVLMKEMVHNSKYWSKVLWLYWKKCLIICLVNLLTKATKKNSKFRFKKGNWVLATSFLVWEKTKLKVRYWSHFLINAKACWLNTLCFGYAKWVHEFLVKSDCNFCPKDSFFYVVKHTVVNGRCVVCLQESSLLWQGTVLPS